MTITSVEAQPEASAKPVISHMTDSEKLLKASTPTAYALVLCGLVGEGKTFEEVIGAAVDASIPDSELPEGVSRDAVKNGLSSMLDGFKTLFGVK